MAQSIVNEQSLAGRRRSRRFPFAATVEATWQNFSGKIFRETGRATEVNSPGWLVRDAWLDYCSAGDLLARITAALPNHKDQRGPKTKTDRKAR
jgi:hypothetical protein